MQIFTFGIVSLLFFAPFATHAMALSVPFTSQAPMGIWSEPWQNACEETSIVMVDYFYAGKTFTPTTARDAISNVVRVKNNYYGFSLDEPAFQIAQQINNFTPWEATVVADPSLAQLKNELDFSRPVILPAYGQTLVNPHYRNGGPDYHMIVLTGYDDATQEFITKDPGTQYGNDWRYSFSTIMDAMHDFVPGQNVGLSPARAVFTQRNVDASRLFDGDKDGLTKEKELKYGAVLYLKDSDGDGMSDGAEVAAGTSPVRKSTVLYEHRLVKASDSPNIYFIEQQQLRKISTIAQLISYSRTYGNVLLIPSTIVKSFPVGTNAR